MATGALGLDAELWDVLACPNPEHGELSPVEPTDDLPEGGLKCAACALVFPIRGGIPVMLVDEAISAN